MDENEDKETECKIDPKLMKMTGDVQRTLKGKRFTMKPRPDQEKIEKGMSSKFLKMHRHWYFGKDNIFRKAETTKKKKYHRKRHSSGKRLFEIMNETGKKIKHAIYR